MNRRGFFTVMLAAAAAPAIVKASNLMAMGHMARQAIERPTTLVLYADGVTDDTIALQAAIDGQQVVDVSGRQLCHGRTLLLPSGIIRTTDTIFIGEPVNFSGGCNQSF